MPIYQYKCLECGSLEEHMLSSWKSPDPKCSVVDCVGVLIRILSATNFQLKGGGWYADGYASKKPESDDE